MRLRRPEQPTEPPRRRGVEQVPKTKASNFFSYHANKQRDPSDGLPRRGANIPAKQQARQSMVSWRHAPIILAIIVFAVCALYSTTLSADVRIQVTSHSAQLLRDQSEYQAAASKLMNRSLLNKSKITFDANAFARELTNQYPELASVFVSVPLMGHKPVIELLAAEPALFVASEKGIFAIDSNGKALMRASDVPRLKDLKLPTVRDDANLPIEVGESSLSSKDVEFITTLVQQLSAKNIIVSSLTLPSLASELHVRIEGAPYYIKFNLLTDARVTVGQFIAAKKKFDTDKIIPQEYVDSRVEEKVFYK